MTQVLDAVQISEWKSTDAYTIKFDLVQFSSTTLPMICVLSTLSVSTLVFKPAVIG